MRTPESTPTETFTQAETDAARELVALVRLQVHLAAVALRGDPRYAIPDGIEVSRRAYSAAKDSAMIEQQLPYDDTLRAYYAYVTRKKSQPSSHDGVYMAGLEVTSADGETLRTQYTATLQGGQGRVIVREPQGQEQVTAMLTAMPEFAREAHHDDGVHPGAVVTASEVDALIVTAPFPITLT